MTQRNKKRCRDWKERSLDHFKVWEYIGRPQNLSPKLGKALTIKMGERGKSKENKER